jgi:hypothetical protein
MQGPSHHRIVSDVPAVSHGHLLATLRLSQAREASPGPVGAKNSLAAIKETALKPRSDISMLVPFPSLNC